MPARLRLLAPPFALLLGLALCAALAAADPPETASRLLLVPDRVFDGAAESARTAPFPIILTSGLEADLRTPAAGSEKGTAHFTARSWLRARHFVEL